MTEPSPDLRVVVVTWNPGPSLDALLDSLPAAISAPYEVVLADNASSRPPQPRPGVRLIPTGSNLGYGRAANIGARGSPARWLLVVNPDVVLHPGSLDALLAAAERWPGAGALGPAILTVDGQLYPSARNIPSLGRGIGHALLGWCWPANPWTAAYRRERGVPREGPAGWLSGSCLLLRQRAFDAVGGFDPGFFMYVEDLDLCERIGLAGWQVVYVPSAVVSHEGGHATAQVPRAMLRAHHASMYRYLARRHRLLAPVLGAGLALRYLASLVIERVGAGAAPTRGAEILAEQVTPEVPTS